MSASGCIYGKNVLRHSANLFWRNKYQVAVPVRFLNLQEYQSKQLMTEHGIRVQKFEVAESVKQANEIASTLKVPEFVIKAQILAGGRGKGVFSSGMKGGVKLTKDPNEVVGYVEKMLGHKLVTKQTGEAGVEVKKVMIAEALDIKRETYLAILLDRDSDGPVVVGSPEGGVDIEEVAARHPDFIFKEKIDIMDGMTEEAALRMANNLKFEGSQLEDAASQIRSLYDMFIKVDATQIEINPLGETADGRVVCFDAKFNFDNNAAFRQSSIFAMNDMAETDPREQEAARHHLNYIGMDGNIGCLVNGAGLAMATMDIIKLHGAEPANFLDVGGSVKEDQVFHAFQLLTSDPNVKAILVNIFGGIVDCATIARGITSASQKVQLSVPLVVRLEGTNVEKAKEIINASKMAIIPADSLEDAAVKVCASLN